MSRIPSRCPHRAKAHYSDSLALLSETLPTLFTWSFITFENGKKNQEAEWS